MKENLIFIFTALLIGLFGALLSVWGNPINTGICISCFMENFSGALRLHNNMLMQYIRPEMIFIVIGSFVSAVVRREFITRYSASIIHSFLGGIFMIIGSAVFIGCPIKMLLKLAGGDLNSLAGIIGTIFGVWLAVRLLREDIDTSLFKTVIKRNDRSSIIIPLSVIFLISLYFLKGELFAESVSGAGAEKSPVIYAISVGLIIGIFSQYSRFCVTGSIRNSIILRKTTGFMALLALVLSALIVNAIFERLKFGVIGQPGSHTEYLWSFISMTLVGYIAVIIDGCPFRQLVKMGEGDVNAFVCFLGMLIGGAFVQNFKILSDSSGPTLMGKIGVFSGILIFSFLSYNLILKNEKN
ncbi:MAG: YedE family putative selenium transporter [Proteobacteria bacterium]|nr:YedE family putative selenium transporter [Pseudomonadota bacterium]